MLAEQRRAAELEIIRTDGVGRIADLADRFGVSRWTVHRDLDLLAQQGLLYRSRGGALAIPGPTETSTTEQIPPATTAARIGVIIPSDRYYFGSVLDGVRDRIADAGLAVAVVGWDQPDATRLATVRELRADALILAGTPAAGLGGLELDLPAVLVEREVPPTAGGAIWSVSTDAWSGFDLALRYLSDLGHRRVGLASLFLDGFSRWRGPWSDRLVAHGMDLLEPLSLTDDNVRWPLPEQEHLDRLVARIKDLDITALLCHNDLAARVLTRELRLSGHSIPGDLSVIAWDDEIAGGPPLPMTAISPAKREIGQTAADLALHLVTQPGSATRRVQLAPQLVVRNSTGLARG